MLRKSLLYKGKAGRAKVAEETQRNIEKQKAREMQMKKPMRFWVEPGKKKEFIICDDEPNTFMYEHNIKDPSTGKWNYIVSCIKETENCPVCEHAKESTYVMFLTVIDLSSFKDRRGVVHNFSRKLLVVKSAQQEKFLRRYKRLGSLRGARFESYRDGSKSSAIGNDIEYQSRVSKKRLSSFVRRGTNVKGEAYEQDCSVVIDYEEMIGEPPTVEELEALMGVEASAGSARETERMLDEDDDWDDDDDDDEEWDDDEDKDEDGDDGEDVDENDDEDDGEDEDDEEEEEEEKPKRTARRKSEPVKEESKRRTKRRTRVARKEKAVVEKETEDDDDDDYDDDTPF